MTIHWGYLIVAFFLVCFGIVYAWLEYESEHAPLVDEDGHYVDENGKRIK